MLLTTYLPDYLCNEEKQRIMGGQQRLPESIEDKLNALWVAIIGFNGHGILSRVERIEDSINEIRNSMWTRKEHFAFEEHHNATDKEYGDRLDKRFESWDQRTERRKASRLHSVELVIALLACIAAIGLTIVDIVK